MKLIPFQNVDITGGFYAQKQKLLRDVTVGAVRDRFEESGRFAAFRCDWKEGMPNRPHVFWDSDVAKWIEGVAYLLEKGDAPELYEKAEEIISHLIANQMEDGYFNTHYQTQEIENRFSHRNCHELYCAGHLIEAAIAWKNATGEDAFLRAMCRYADLIERVFKIEHSAGFRTPGHEEIELALVKLYHSTGERRYLELAKYFIDERGRVPEFREDRPREFQSHAPCREQHVAEGHAVRAGYLYAAMTDLSREYGDSELKAACDDLFGDIFNHKMYLTAGVGSIWIGESFTLPYDLPSAQAYTETCASIALVLFLSRMQGEMSVERGTLDSRFGDVIERALYNGILSGVSLDGKSFFYQNPLEIDLEQRQRSRAQPDVRENFPPSHRVELFDCSCCPPNIVRFIPSVGNYLFALDGDTLLVHQFMTAKANVDGMTVDMTSGYPYDGKTVITVRGGAGKRLAVRVPFYTADRAKYFADGTEIKPEVTGGYAFFRLGEKTEITLCYDVSPRVIYPNPRIADTAGKCAVLAGPLVYCAEGVDNGPALHTYRIGASPDFCRREDRALGVVCYDVSACRQESIEGNPLYAFGQQRTDAVLHMIPYFAFSNRGETDMRIWFPVA